MRADAKRFQSIRLRTSVAGCIATTPARSATCLRHDVPGATRTSPSLHRTARLESVVDWRSRPKHRNACIRKTRPCRSIPRPVRPRSPREFARAGQWWRRASPSISDDNARAAGFVRGPARSGRSSVAANSSNSMQASATVRALRCKLVAQQRRRVFLHRRQTTRLAEQNFFAALGDRKQRLRSISPRPLVA